MEDNQQEIFAQLIKTNSRSMFRAARMLLDSDTDAEDAVGQAILSAWESWGKLRNPLAARSWLLKITVNCAKAQRRKQQKVVCMENADREFLSQPAEIPIDLWQAIRELPEDQRMVISLYYYEDMSVSQVAQVLNIPPGTVKSRLARGRRRLGEMLKEDYNNV